MSAVSERIKALIEQSGLSYRRLAKKVGVSNVTVRNWAIGHSEPNREGLEALCEIFGVTPAYVMFGDANSPVQTLVEDGIVSIPHVNAEVSCGHGFLNTDELELIRFVRVSQGFIRRYCPSANVRSLQIMAAFGDSMEPTLHEGDAVIVDISEKKIVRDGMYVVRIGEGLFVKRVQVTPEGLRLLSDNKFYEPINTTPESIEVIGRAYVGLCIKRL
jgi:transcriptional regulator with XRE-family HTH domain